MADILVHGLTQNNLEARHIPGFQRKNYGVYRRPVPGKSSIVFDTIAAESQRQMNAAYLAFVCAPDCRSIEKPAAERIDNLTASSGGGSVPWRKCPLHGGTISGLYASLRLCCFHASGSPMRVRPPTSPFNDPNGMCKTCPAWERLQRSMGSCSDMDKSWNEGCIKDSLYRPVPGTGNSMPSPVSSI